MIRWHPANRSVASELHPMYKNTVLTTSRGFHVNVFEKSQHWLTETDQENGHTNAACGHFLIINSKIAVV